MPKELLHYFFRLCLSSGLQSLPYPYGGVGLWLPWEHLSSVPGFPKVCARDLVLPTAMSAHGHLLGAQGVHLGPSSAQASSQMQFFLLNPMWFRDLAPVKSEGFFFFYSTGCTTFLPFWLQHRQGAQLEGKVSQWESEEMDSTLSWWQDCHLGLRLRCLADVLHRLFLMVWVK